MRTAFLRRSLVGALAIVAVAACGGSSSGAGPSGTTANVGSGQLTGAGSTFSQPFFDAAFYAYNQKYPQVSINYQSIGSGGGIQQFIKGTVEFGATDVPMGGTDIASAGGPSSLVQIPVLVGTVAVSYNLPNVAKLNLDGQALSEIFLGRIKTWNDPAISALNAGTTLPSTAITVVHRSDGSGTTYAFTNYLSDVNPDWKSKVGTAKSVAWPTGVAGKGNEGVGQLIKSTEGSIGYNELAYVVQSKLQMAYLKNQAGGFLQATQAGGTAAAAQATNVSATNFSIVNEPGATSYPITTFSWVVLKATQADQQKGLANVSLWQWFVSPAGQAYGVPLQYSALPKDVTSLATTTLRTVNGPDGKPLLS